MLYGRAGRPGLKSFMCPNTSSPSLGPGQLCLVLHLHPPHLPLSHPQHPLHPHQRSHRSFGEYHIRSTSVNTGFTSPSNSDFQKIPHSNPHSLIQSFLACYTPRSIFACHSTHTQAVIQGICTPQHVAIRGLEYRMSF